MEPVPYAKLDNPQTLNLYPYAGDNPESVFDPDGHDGKKAAGYQTVQTGQCTLDSPCGHKKVKVKPANAHPVHEVAVVNAKDKSGRAQVIYAKAQNTSGKNGNRRGGNGARITARRDSCA